MLSLALETQPEPQMKAFQLVMAVKSTCRLLAQISDGLRSGKVTVHDGLRDGKSARSLLSEGKKAAFFLGVYSPATPVRAWGGHSPAAVAAV